MYSGDKETDSWLEGYHTGLIVGAVTGCPDWLLDEYQKAKLELMRKEYELERDFGWMKNRECMYCISMFDCKERPDTEYCLNFKPRNAVMEAKYKDWRYMNGKTKN